MNSEKLKIMVRLVRPVNVAIVFATIAVAALIAKPSGGDWILVFIGSLAGAMIAAGGNAINDYFDIAIDKINRPDRPLPSGLLTPDEAHKVWVVLSSGGLLLCLFLGIWNVLIAIFWVASLYVYSRSLKRTVVVGNLAVALMTGLAFPFGAVLAGRPELGTYPGIFAFLANLAREFLKDVEDVDGDATAGAETLPVKYGPEAGLIGASGAIALLIIMTLIPYVAGFYDQRYLLVILLVNLGLSFTAISMWYDQGLSNLRRLSRILKICMIGGLFAIVLGSA